MTKMPWQAPPYLGLFILLKLFHVFHYFSADVSTSGHVISLLFIHFMEIVFPQINVREISIVKSYEFFHDRISINFSCWQLVI
jgi:hypothetical protein